MAARWHPDISADPLWPSPDPVVMNFNSSEAWPPVPRGWVYGSTSIALRPQPVAGSYSEGTQDAICPGGWFVVHQNVQNFADQARQERYRWAVDGIYRIDVRTGAVDRARFKPELESSLNSLHYAGSPGGRQVVVAEHIYVDSEAGDSFDHADHPLNQAMPRKEYRKVALHYARTRLVLATFDGAAPRTIGVFRAGLMGKPDSSYVQWSPDGRLIAVSMHFRMREREARTEITVLDPSTGEIAARLEGATLAGSASWGPWSDRLVVEGDGDEAWVHHLDGKREPITVLPPYGGRDLRPIRVLGMADNEHLLTLRIYGADGILMRTSLRDGSHEQLLRWEGQKHMYPVLAQMPPETWM